MGTTIFLIIILLVILGLKIYLRPNNDNVKEHTVQTVDEDGTVHLKKVKKDKIDKNKLKILKSKLFYKSNKENKK